MRLLMRDHGKTKGSTGSDMTALSWIAFRDLLDLVPDRIYAKDCEARFTFANAATATGMGASGPEALLGKTDFDFFPEEVAADYMRVERAVLERGEAIVALEQDTLNLASGRIECLQTTKIPLRDACGRVSGLIGLARDVSALKHVQSNLHGEVQRLAEANNKLAIMQSKLIEAERVAATGRVAARLAHELNTPIGNALVANSALADLYLMVEKKLVAGQLSRKDLMEAILTTRESQELVQRCLERSAGLIGALKRSDLPVVTEAATEFSVSVLVAEVLARVEAQARGCGIVLKCSIAADLRLVTYRALLLRIVTELVSNAVQHAFCERPGGHVEVAARALDDCRVEIVCLDDGLGVSDRVMASAFEPLSKVHMGMSGTGMGLHEAHQIARSLLAGDLTVRTLAGNGSEFRLVLPAIVGSEARS